MDIWGFLELGAVFCSLLFIVLLVRQKMSCWFWGIVSSLLSVLLFLHVRLYAETILYCIYIVIGGYGWYNWRKQQKKSKSIVVWGISKHIPMLILAVICSLVLGWMLAHFTNANNPYADATIGVFSIIASILEAQKIISTWIFWIAINLATVLLYWLRGLEWYSALMIVYTVLSVIGWLKWRRTIREETTPNGYVGGAE